MDQFWNGGLTVHNRCFLSESDWNRSNSEPRRVTVQNEWFSLSICLKTNQFWAGGLIVQNLFFSSTLLSQTEQFWAWGQTVHNKCFRCFRYVVKNVNFWAGAMTVQNQFNYFIILLETNKFWAGGMAVQDQLLFFRHPFENETILSRSYDWPESMHFV